MAITQPNKVIEQLRQAALSQPEPDLTDGQLLERFVSLRDGRALEDLVRRHGPMVFGVCRRVLRNHHDAEDAFQATFLVLVRKAASVVPRELVANWLYGVACQTARRAKVAAAKRQGRETQVAAMPEPETAEPDCWHDVQPLLDLELSRLPDKYRVPIILCDLQGKTHKEAARQLGCPIGTLSGRLSRGRKLLARRLARYGFALSAGSLAACLSQQAASAAVPTALLSATIGAADVLAGGHATAQGAISANVAGLTEGVLKAMFLTKLKLAFGVLLALALGAGIAVNALLYPTQAAEQTDAHKAAPPKEPTEARTPADGQKMVEGKRGPRDGELDERKLARITAPVDGTVEKIYKATRQRVKEGEPVADLYTPDLVVASQNLLDAVQKGNADLEKAARARLLLWGVERDQLLQMIQSGKPISRLTIRSPVDGVIVRTHRIKGDQAKLGDPLYEVAELSAADNLEKPPAEQGTEPAKVRELQQERLATLKKLVEVTKAAYATGQATFADVARANAQLLEAELEQCKTDQERLAIHEKAVALAKEAEKVAEQRYNAAQAIHASVLAATVNRLQAEIAYERMKARLAPAPK